MLRCNNHRTIVLIVRRLSGLATAKLLRVT